MIDKTKNKLYYYLYNNFIWVAILKTSEFYKAHNLCIICHKEKPREGKVTCDKCQEHIRKYRKENPDKQRKHSRDKRKRLKENGLCLICGKRKADTGYSCKQCGELRKLKRRVISIRKKKGTWDGEFWSEKIKQKIAERIIDTMYSARVLHEEQN